MTDGDREGLKIFDAGFAEKCHREKLQKKSAERKQRKKPWLLGEEKAGGGGEDLRAVDNGVEIGIFNGFVSARSRGAVIYGLNSGGGEECRVHPVGHSRFFRCASVERCCGLADALCDACVARTDEGWAIEQEADSSLLTSRGDDGAEFIQNLRRRFAGNCAALDLKGATGRIGAETGAAVDGGAML